MKYQYFLFSKNIPYELRYKTKGRCVTIRKGGTKNVYIYIERESIFKTALYGLVVDAGIACSVTKRERKRGESFFALDLDEATKG